MKLSINTYPLGFFPWFYCSQFLWKRRLYTVWNSCLWYRIGWISRLSEQRNVLYFSWVPPQLEISTRKPVVSIILAEEKVMWGVQHGSVSEKKNRDNCQETAVLGFSPGSNRVLWESKWVNRGNEEQKQKMWCELWNCIYSCWDENYGRHFCSLHKASCYLPFLPGQIA